MNAGPHYQNDGLPDVPLNARTVVAIAKMWGPARVLGDDTAGRWAIEFPDAFRALACRDTLAEWAMVLRDPITDPDAPCVLTTRAMTDADRAAD